ncbi:pyridoxal phosphate-dependent aminotransferase [Streptomyces lavendulocolor]|uniref:pyridoxal phosphate-dependent aminotransferase n=1 Tax=Streptomyces lavendulocolor TaxID=67316 RepID=UPI0033D3304C
MSRPLCSQRLSGLGATIFSEIHALAEEHGAINLGPGLPDTDGPAQIREAAVEALRHGLGNQYPPAIGIPELREAVAWHQEHWYQLPCNPDDEVLITTGATEAIVAALLAFVELGDEVIVLEPYYDLYAAGITLAGGIRVPVTLHADSTGFSLDLDELCAAVTSRTRAIILNTPHNPTGGMRTQEELSRIAELACEHDLIVITDEVYEHLIFDGRVHLPIATFPGMWDRTVTISSAGKTFSFTGWKVGWLTGAPRLVAAVRSVKQYLTFASSGPFQYAIAAALRLPDHYFHSLRADLQRKRNLLVEGLYSAGFGPIRPAGTFYITADIGPLAGKGVIDCDDGQLFCRSLPLRCGVAAIPNSSFYDSTAGKQFVRFSFCKRVELLHEAVARLQTLTR